MLRNKEKQVARSVGDGFSLSVNFRDVKTPRASQILGLSLCCCWSSTVGEGGAHPKLTSNAAVRSVNKSVLGEESISDVDVQKPLLEFVEYLNDEKLTQVKNCLSRKLKWICRKQLEEV